MLIFSTIISEKFLIPRRTGRDVTINLYGPHVKCPLFLLDFDGI